MTWSDRALLITAISVAIANLATALWNLLRSCQTWHLLKKNQDTVK